MALNGRRGVMERALQACFTGGVDALPELFTKDVSGWAPNMLVTSLDELKDVVAYRDTSLSDVNLEINAIDVVGNKGYAEYRVSAVFSGPFAVDQETVIQPNGRTILLGAAMVAEFDEDKISAFRNYFDDVTLLAQMIDV